MLRPKVVPLPQTSHFVAITLRSLANRHRFGQARRGSACHPESFDRRTKDQSAALSHDGALWFFARLPTAGWLRMTTPHCTAILRRRGQLEPRRQPETPRPAWRFDTFTRERGRPPLPQGPGAGGAPRLPTPPPP